MTTLSNKFEIKPVRTVTENEWTTETVYKRVYSVVSSPADATTEDQMKIVESSGVLQFWDDPDEDIYDE